MGNVVAWILAFNCKPVTCNVLTDLNDVTCSMSANVFVCCVTLNPLHFDVLTEKLSQAKEESLNMHQMLDQTLMELNNL